MLALLSSWQGGEESPPKAFKGAEITLEPETLHPAAAAPNNGLVVKGIPGREEKELDAAKKGSGLPTAETLRGGSDPPHYIHPRVFPAEPGPGMCFIDSWSGLG